ncbi:nickel transporter permease [Paenibacillus sp. 481]|uniref:nickel transporter permease n=1 Tax=Paenibacillus sp. 481 TaxID=2835869 RepID=UPI001E57E2AA|nr:nickel transporter permease [Paenibacillus sp. 481]
MWHSVRRSPITMLGMSLMTVIVLLTLVGPYAVPNDPLTVQMSERLQASSMQYPLGTDHLGRCIFSRLVAGAEVTLGISALIIVTVTVIGIPLGLLSGYVGGRLDTVLMRLIDGVSALPEFIIAIAISGFLGPSVTNLVLAIVLVKWIGYTRVVRSIVLSERVKEYVSAARVAGCGTWTILWRHLLPQIISPVIVLAALDIGKTIMLVSLLSYLGLGAQPPMPEWGAMLNDGRPYFQTVPELMIYPGLAIMLVVISCNLISDGLRDTLDVRGTPK